MKQMDIKTKQQKRKFNFKKTAKNKRWNEDKRK